MNKLDYSQSQMWQIGVPFFWSRILVHMITMLWVELCSIKIPILKS